MRSFLLDVGQTTFKRIGMPCRADRFPFDFLSLSSAAAWARADGFNSRTARSAGPFRLTSSIRAKYACIDQFQMKIDTDVKQNHEPSPNLRWRNGLHRGPVVVQTPMLRIGLEIELEVDAVLRYYLQMW